MSVEQPVEMCLVGFGEVVGPAQQGEAGSEQVRLERWGTQLRIAALYLASYQGESLGEPADDVEPVEHMASVGQILRDGGLIDTPGAYLSSCGLAGSSSVCPGGVFVVGGSVFEAAVEDAYESVGEGSQCLVVDVAGCSPLVVEPSGSWASG